MYRSQVRQNFSSCSNLMTYDGHFEFEIWNSKVMHMVKNNSSALSFPDGPTCRWAQGHKAANIKEAQIQLHPRIVAKAEEDLASTDWRKRVARRANENLKRTHIAKRDEAPRLRDEAIAAVLRFRRGEAVDFAAVYSSRDSRLLSASKDLSASTELTGKFLWAGWRPRKWAVLLLVIDFNMFSRILKASKKPSDC